GQSKTDSSNDTKSGGVPVAFGLPSLLGSIKESVLGTESVTDATGEVTSGVATTQPVYRPTIDTTGVARAAIDLAGLNPFKLIAVAGFLVYANLGLKKKIISL
ncbi:hypothetical protein KC573_03765, partial [candidate division WWE3 bacterium]|nr:hypothetical protein [candidate division WWE3 bacterium]